MNNTTYLKKTLSIKFLYRIMQSHSLLTMLACLVLS